MITVGYSLYNLSYYNAVVYIQNAQTLQAVFHFRKKSSVNFSWWWWWRWWQYSPLKLLLCSSKLILRQLGLLHLLLTLRQFVS